MHCLDSEWKIEVSAGGSMGLGKADPGMRIGSRACAGTEAEIIAAGGPVNESIGMDRHDPSELPLRSALEMEMTGIFKSRMR
jgi:hypothetical protein